MCIFYSPYVTLMCGSIESQAIDGSEPTNFWLSNTWRKLFKAIAYCKSIFERLKTSFILLDMISNLL